MKALLAVWCIVALCSGIMICAGCSSKPLGSVSEAIQNSQTFKTVQEKADYMVKQAEIFYNSKDFQKAIDTAQYVLNNIDRESEPAKALIEKAKAQLQAAAQKAATDATNKLFGK